MDEEIIQPVIPGKYTLNRDVYSVLTGQACASVRFRARKEIFGEEPDIDVYLDEILHDDRINYVLSWQNDDGYLGTSFHGGWIPAENLKYYGKGAEAALRFLSEMGVPKTYPVVERCLSALLKENWNPDLWKWSKIYQPELGFFGPDHIRAVVFAYFGIEEHDFVLVEIQRTLDYIKKVREISSLSDITGIYRKKLYFNNGIPLPDLYCLKLLAFTKSWRVRANIQYVAEVMSRLIEFSPLPQIYIKAGNQLVAPAAIFPRNLKKQLSDFEPRDWFPWLHTMELFARMGVVNEIKVLQKQVKELESLLVNGRGFFPIKPAPRSFTHWSVYNGLALEGSWRHDTWKYDLTFRSLLILKLSGMLK